ncbi:MAG: HNH endonuclease, partial [Planctomycetota bacterium]
MTDEPTTLFIEIEDLLFPQRALDVYERCMYYHFVRHTHLIGRESRMFPLPALRTALGISEDRARKTIRSLEKKGCIELQRSRKGHLVKVFTPEQMGISAADEEGTTVDIESIDFFSNRTYVEPLLAREDGRCFYCLASLTAETCVLDHVSAQVDGGGNHYKNIVAACHDC